MELIVAVIVTDEETDVTEPLWVAVIMELLWVVVIVDVDIWDVFCETLVILGVDFKVVEVIFVETPGVVILDVATGFKVVVVIFFEENGVVDGFTVLLEDAFIWLEDTCVVVPGDVVLVFCGTIDLTVLLGNLSWSELSTATFSRASSSSAPSITTAQPPRAPSPIVLRAGRSGLVGPQPRWRRR